MSKLWVRWIVVLAAACALPVEGTESEEDVAATLQALLTQTGAPASGPGSVAPVSSGDVPDPQRITLSNGGSYFVVRRASPAPDGRVLLYVPGGAGFTSDFVNSGLADMLRNFARKGYTVVVPIYPPLTQLFSTVLVPAFLQRAEDICRQAINGALAGNTTRPLAVAGHSTGALIALRVARNNAGGPAIPPVRAAILHEPSTANITGSSTTPSFAQATLQILPSVQTRLLIIQAESSISDPASNAKAIWGGSGHIPRAQRNFLRVLSDTRPTSPDPDLISNHPGVQSGIAGTVLNMIDHWGYRRPTEGAILSAFGTPPSGYDAFCSALGSACNPTRDMGNFTDGTPLNKIQNAADLENAAVAANRIPTVP